jgi:hypothetical protein
VRRLNIITPALKISAEKEYGSFLKTSGAKYPGVPHCFFK